MADLLLIRILLVASISSATYLLRPLGLEPWQSAILGAMVGVAIVLIESRVRKVPLKRLLGAMIGGIFGVLGAFLISLVLWEALPEEANVDEFLSILLLFAGIYIGTFVGSAKGDLLNLSSIELFGGDSSGSSSELKILDTSVIIDGRIADIAETSFIDGALVIPQFVLRELQQVADSADANKRARGRRGLDILQKLQQMPKLDIRIMEEDFPSVPEVDLKLIELAKLLDARVMTNDFNLNKVATLHGVEVLNINELANALKPVVLPGEIMRVFILKEGKEPTQGVAYLDDGTMVVVDNARRQISKTIDVSVTSVLQTTAGKMIFARYDERTRAITEKDRERSGRSSATPAAGSA